VKLSQLIYVTVPMSKMIKKEERNADLPRICPEKEEYEDYQ
jgi:hypothetical protein